MLKFMQKCEALGMFKTILKKENKAGRSALPDFKTYYKVTVLETAVQTYGWKCRSMGGQGGTRNKASPYGQRICRKDARAIQWGKE